MPMVMIERNDWVAIPFSLSSISMPMPMSMSMVIVMVVFFDENTADDNCCVPMMVWKTIHRKMRREDERASSCDVIS
jgi:hypothetical protein